MDLLDGVVEALPDEFERFQRIAAVFLNNLFQGLPVGLVHRHPRICLKGQRIIQNRSRAMEGATCKNCPQKKTKPGRRAPGLVCIDDCAMPYPPRIASLAALATRNLTTRLALIWI